MSREDVFVREEKMGMPDVSEELNEKEDVNEKEEVIPVVQPRGSFNSSSSSSSSSVSRSALFVEDSDREQDELAWSELKSSLVNPVKSRSNRDIRRPHRFDL